jgi:putative ABC transport system permease protein
MFKFLLKGVFRDRHRWLFPILIVMFSVALLVFAFSFLEGFRMSYIRQTARFSSGHLKVVSRAYAQMLDLKPYDLALMGIEAELADWKEQYPQLHWVERINFGALLDVPDAEGNTRVQADIAGFAVDLLGSDDEIKRLQLDTAIKSGRIPQTAGEILISDIAADKLELKVGDTVTLMGSTIFGAMSMQNFRLTGTVEFGVYSLDRGAVVADLGDIRKMLDMQDAAGELLCYFKSGEYKLREATQIMNSFNERYSDPEDEFSAQMLRLNDQGNLGPILKMFDYSLLWMSFGFVMVMVIVLWNAGLLNSIRRYGEFGVRLAIGESKRRVYGSLLAEALIVGIAGSALGLLIGSAVSLYFNNTGMDMSIYNRSSSMMSENMLYTSLNAQAVIASFIPGLLSTLMGAALAGIAIFKRDTSQLFKELET